ncbi:unnamed protein product, partial [Prorocentrum cordatum]
DLRGLGGVVVLSVYLRDGEGLSANNLGIFWQLAQYLGVLEAEGYHWAVMGDWNMEADVLDFGWIRKLRAQIRVADAPTCRQGSCSKIDYFVVSKSLACFAAAPPRLDRGASAWPHWPVHLPLRALRVETRQQVLDEPGAVPREPAQPGCARGPWRWTEVMRCVQAARDDQGLQIIWDLLLEGVEAGILDGPPQKQKLRGPEAHAWAALAGWASELLSKRGRLGKLLAALCSHRQEEGREAVAARDECMKSIAATVAHLKMFLADIEDHVHWRALPPRAQLPFRVDANWAEAGFERGLKRALAEAKEKQRKLVQADEARSKERVDEAFRGGAGAAHATSKVPVLQEVLPALQKEGSAALVDREVKPWIDTWNYRGLASMELPLDAHAWDMLPPLQLHGVRDVMRSFPWRTGVGQSGIPPRVLGDLSDGALHAMIAVYRTCEELLAWPSGRLINTMVRLSKPDGGCRLIGLMPTLVRVWGRARRPITKAWELVHPSALVWGTGPGRSSSDSACELNLAFEQARLGGRDSAHVVVWKAYELVAPEAQLVEARALGFPMRLVWMLLITYRQPRTLAAFNTTSDLFVAWQGNIAGCGHASSLLLVLTLRVLQRAHSIAPSVTPRGLVDDATLGWSGPRGVPGDSLSEALKSFSLSMVELKLVMQPQKSGCLASSGQRARLLATSMRSAGLAEKFWVRNLGRELHGRKVLRTHEKRRLQALAARRSRVAMLIRAAGRRAAALVAAGLSLRLAMRRVDYDPIYAAAIPLVTRLASRVWEGRGPLGATWLALGRIGWTMTAAWALQTDLGETLSMLRVAPRDIKGALVEGIQRWQCSHLPEGQGETLWPRAVRAIACKARPAAEPGLRGAKDTLMHRWCVCPALMVPQGEELEHQEPFRMPIVEMRHQLEEAEQKWTIGDSELSLAYGLPLLPAMPPPAPSENVVVEWGAAQAACGPLPGPRLTVGRAERQACLVPLVQAGSVQVIVSVLQALVTEGNDWSPMAQSARARHASIWRQFHAAAARRGGPPPRFRWVPARRSLQQALGEGLRPLGWLGNCWADFFANLGAEGARLPNGAVEALHAELQRALDTATFLGWAAARICQLDLWRLPREDGILQRQQARTLLDCRPCQPTELGRMRARCSQGRPLASSAAVSASLQAAERPEEEGLLPMSGAPTTAEGQRWTMQQKVDYLRGAAKVPLLRALPTWRRLGRHGHRGHGDLNLAPIEEGSDLFAFEAWGRSGPLEAALGMLASSSWIVDLMGQALAYASCMEECVEYVYRLLDEGVYRGFFAHDSDEMRSAERLGRAEEFCERGWRDGGPFRDARIDETLQLEGEARQVKPQRLRGDHAAASDFLCDRSSARRAGGRRGPFYFTFFEPVGGAYAARALEVSDERPCQPASRRAPREAELLRRGLRCRGQARGRPVVHNEAERSGSPDPGAAIGLEVLCSMQRAFASCWVFDLCDSEAAEDSWMAWAAQYALAWLARPDNVDTRAVVSRRAGSIGLRALVQAMVRQAWLLKADVRRIAVGHLMSLETLGEWLHVAAMQSATLDDVCCTMEDVIGEAVVNLPALPGFAGALPGLGPAGSSGQPSRQAGLPRPRGLRGRGVEALRRSWPGTWHNPQLPLVNAMQGGPDALGSDSDGAGDWPHPDAAPSGLPPPPPAAAAVQAPPTQPEGADHGVRGVADAVGGDDPVLAVQLAEVHLWHGLRTAGQYAFCCKCGAFAQLKGVDRAKGLKAECGGRLLLGPQATAGEKKKRLYLGRLLSGKDPYTG